MSTLRDRVTVIGPAAFRGNPVPMDPVIYEGGIAYDGQRPLYSNGTSWVPFASIEEVQSTLQSPTEITVGPTGDFPTLGQAMREAAKYSPGIASTLEATPLVNIRILSGVTLAEQVRVFFRDMGYVKIISDDPVVDVDITNFAFFDNSDNEGVPANPNPNQTAVTFLQFEAGVAPRIFVKFNAIGTHFEGKLVNAITVRAGATIQIGAIDYSDDQVSSDLYDFKYGFVGNWDNGFFYSGINCSVNQCDFAAKSTCVAVSGVSGGFTRVRLRRTGASPNTQGFYFVGGRYGINSCDFRVREGVPSEKDFVDRAGGATVSYLGPSINVSGLTPTLGQVGNTFPFETNGFSRFWEQGPSTPTEVVNPRIRGVMWPDAFTAATLPNPVTAAGQMVYCTDGDFGSPCLAVSDGTNWKIVALGGTIL